MVASPRQVSSSDSASLLGSNGKGKGSNGGDDVIKKPRPTSSSSASISASVSSSPLISSSSRRSQQRSRRSVSHRQSYYQQHAKKGFSFERIMMLFLGICCLVLLNYQHDGGDYYEEEDDNEENGSNNGNGEDQSSSSLKSVFGAGLKTGMSAMSAFASSNGNDNGSDGNTGNNDPTAMTNMNGDTMNNMNDANQNGMNTVNQNDIGMTNGMTNGMPDDMMNNNDSNNGMMNEQEDVIEPAVSVFDMSGSNNNNGGVGSDGTTNTMTISNSIMDTQAPDPKLIDPNYIPQHAPAPLWKNKHNIVHILTTRFSQMQTNLLHLGQARLELFKTFTLPSVNIQSTKEFLWLIFTDPSLDAVLLNQLKAELKTHFVGNVVLIGMNDIFKDFVDDDWMDETTAVLYGNRGLVRDYQNAARSHVLVQTRLDADDSIFKDLMRNVQLQTKASLGVEAFEHKFNPNSFSPKQYRVFCTEWLIEWGYFNPWNASSTKGHLYGQHIPTFCVTAGLTYAYQVGTRSKDLPTRAHNKIDKLMQQCDRSSGILHNCVERINAGNAKYIMIRSRTPTSTAMQGVIPSNKVKKDKLWPQRQDATWNAVLQPNFGVSPESVWKLRSVFAQNMELILKDAIKGHCAKREYGCKESAVKDLKKLLQEVKKHSG